MKSNSSRLHTLERSLKKPPKSRVRAKARALTVLRLEGATGRDAAQHVPAKLPQDLEEQIAVVRGRAAAKPSRGLLQLEERLLRTGEMETRGPVIQRYDHGVPPAPVPAAPVVNQAHALSAEPPLAGSAFGGRFNVESFEETSAPGVGQCIGLPSTDYKAFPPADAGVKTELNVSTPPATIAVPPRVDAVGAVPWAGAQSRADRARVLNDEQKAVAENFHRDLAAMLSDTSPKVEAPEDKQWADKLRMTAQTPPASPQPVVEPATPPVPKTAAHEVFNQMGLAMNYANRFDLGAVELSARFNQFDREMAEESKPTTVSSVPVEAHTLDEFDLVADLSEIAGTQPDPIMPSSARPATSSATATEPDVISSP